MCVYELRSLITCASGVSNETDVCLTGTNLQALMEQAKKPSSSAEIVVVISNRPGVMGLKRASMAGIQTRVCLKYIYVQTHCSYEHVMDEGSSHTFRNLKYCVILTQN